MLGFIVLSMILNNYPFILSTAINQANARRFFPTSENASGTYCWLLHFLSIFIALTCLSFGVLGKLLQKKRRIDYAIKL
jgi:ABC-type dipeptide/oligopeptide/nickel transport system permease subunit